MSLSGARPGVEFAVRGHRGVMACVVYRLVVIGEQQGRIMILHLKTWMDGGDIVFGVYEM